MPDLAFPSTERQFESLLRAAAGETDVALRYSTLPGVARGDDVSERIRAAYWPSAGFLDSGLDGLIVTGNEPKADHLNQEPYWHSLTAVCDKAATSIPSTTFSCLAAHAAVLYFDGIDRVRLHDKRSGVYQHRVEGHHELTTGIGDILRTPHSRWNDLPAEAIRAAGYEVLSASADNGVDIFVRESAERLLVFLQGHLEYEAETLLREYRRDVLRFARGESSRYPSMPAGYLTDAAKDVLSGFQQTVCSRAPTASPPEFPYALAAAGVLDQWRVPAVRIYANWLNWLRHHLGR